MNNAAHTKALVNTLNKLTGVEHSIDFAACYGGRMLVTFDSDGVQNAPLNSRMSPKVFNAFLMGMVRGAILMQDTINAGKVNV